MMDLMSLLRFYQLIFFVYKHFYDYSKMGILDGYKHLKCYNHFMTVPSIYLTSLFFCHLLRHLKFINLFYSELV